jgi:hypothetical protein
MTFWRPAVALVACAVWLAPAPASAAERRIALLVAHPFGGEHLQPLRYTANDLDRMRDVLVTFGDFARADVLVSFGDDAETVVDRFDEVRERIRAAQAAGDRTLFLFYFSGHSMDGDLRLGDTHLPLADVKRLTEGTGATLRLAIIDACRSGALTRIKGATKGEPVAVGVDDGGAQGGLVVITASSEAEDAQESDEVQGSFFTWYFTSGLRGAADVSGDGEVSLSEAYAHAYNGTVVATVGSRGGVQHPSYRFDLRGAGDVVLTDLRRGDSGLVFPAELQGEFVVFDPRRKVVVAELDKTDSRPVRVALAPGDYVVKKREADHLLLGRFAVPAKASTAVDLAMMKRVAFADDYAKGPIVTVGDLRAPTSYRLTAGLGGQSFLSAPARREYFPSLGLVWAQVDFDNLLAEGLGIRLDTAFGGSGKQLLVLEDGSSYEITVSEITGGASLVKSFHPTRWLRLGALVRLGVISVNRQFSDSAMPAQGFSTMTPGVGGEVSVRIASWLQAGAQVRLHYVFFNVDRPQSLMYLDGGLFFTAVLR